MAGFLVASLTGVFFHYLAGWSGGIDVWYGARLEFLMEARFWVDFVLVVASLVIIGVPVGLTVLLASGRERSRRTMLVALGAVLWAFVFPPVLALFVDVGISFAEPSLGQQIEAWMALPVAAFMGWRILSRRQWEW
jgi:hypothetical protein